MTTMTDEALALLDAVLPPAPDREKERLTQRLGALGVFMPNMGVGTVTKGCPSCGGTMIRNYETDSNGKIINRGPYICSGCGAVG